MLGDARRSGASDIAFHDEPLDLMHVADVARAIQVTLAASRLPLAVYNINGFTARVSEMIDAIKRIRPAFDVNVSVQPPAQTFPLISDAAFRADLCFAPEFDLDGLCRDLISRE
jgi:UDP-glucose 4-epimerase